MIINMSYYHVRYIAVIRTVFPLTHVDLVVVLHADLCARYVARDMSQKLIQMIAAKRALLPLAGQIQHLIFQLRSHFTFLPAALRDGVEFRIRVVPIIVLKFLLEFTLETLLFGVILLQFHPIAASVQHYLARRQLCL